MLSFLLRTCGFGYDLHNDETRFVLSISVERMGDESENNENNQLQQET